ncbi:sterol desaturase family protein [Mucilaginibacter gotjawali]|uniref:Sterol desaturase/sphingolipid hydroxylase (Fatty acid hydroxylase superfamily) n=2 Tax=Mucilaginibacter gotjawali TaxID=1550579 RepID=A0A839S7Q0_9SPHI|nr:sterol desaturase family protein [Mucilaginibacter gotjawali]MBB3053816.1 sterol desaturase/sphingolipid hydroxylase (fatty acid hydroxylase superfamily) [Mucilaginibacter gotjawali]BAU54079.1 Fatty acid hydroxylase superfamily protein [Mucilaginibacter gotjawali]
MQQSSEIFFRILGISTLRYFILAGIPFIVYYHLITKRKHAAKIQYRHASRGDFAREILHSMQTTIVFTAILYLVVYTPLKKFTLFYDGITDYPLWWLLAGPVLALLIHDTYFYWMHRLLHHRRLFRFAHLLHHKSTNPSPWTSYSFHFIEACTEGAVFLLIVVVVPMHLVSVTIFVITAFVINVYGHLGYEIAPLWLRNTFVFEIVNTSVYHNMHHSKFKGNYGLYFRLWDRLMGTEHPDYVKEYDAIQQRRLNNDPANE